MFALSEYQNDRAAAVLNVDPADVRARQSIDGRIMVWADGAPAIGFGVTEAHAVDALEADARRVALNASYVARAAGRS